MREAICAMRMPSSYRPVLAGPIFRRLRGVSRHTPSFYNIAMRTAYSRLVRARRSGHAVKMPTIAVEQKMEWTRESKKSGMLEAPEY